LGCVKDNTFLQRQVNVNAAGLNIVGDAANEPSIVPSVSILSIATETVGRNW
jgi:hypothetical protein